MRVRTRARTQRAHSCNKKEAAGRKEKFEGKERSLKNFCAETFVGFAPLRVRMRCTDTYQSVCVCVCPCPAWDSRFRLDTNQLARKGCTTEQTFLKVNLEEETEKEVCCLIYCTPKVDNGPR